MCESAHRTAGEVQDLELRLLLEDLVEVAEHVEVLLGVVQFAGAALPFGAHASVDRLLHVCALDSATANGQSADWE